MKRRSGIILGLGLLLLGVAVWKLCFGPVPKDEPDLGRRWHDQVYGLDDGEVARFVPPPYSPGRMIAFGRSWAGTPPLGNVGQLSYRVRAGKTQHWGMSSATGDLRSALTFCSDLTLADLEVAGGLGRARVDGDWIVRMDAPIERRMKAQESIISAAMDLDLVFEKKMAERDVIVARGKWEFQSIEGGPAARRPRSVHFFIGQIDSQEGAGGGSGKFPELMHRLEEIAHRKVIDEVQVRPEGEVEWSNNRSDNAAARSDFALDQLLANLTKQTSLEFVRTKRPMPIWFITQRSPTTQPTQPGGGK